jgi:hypothetical protein
MKDKLKAEDYVSVLAKKVGKAMTISDNSQVYQTARLCKNEDNGNGRECCNNKEKHWRKVKSQ